MIPKQLVVEAPWWLAEVRSMRCLKCGSSPCDPHHFQRQRHRDDLILPICRGCHTIAPDSIHRIGEWEWQKIHDVDLGGHLIRCMVPMFLKAMGERCEQIVWP